MPNDDPTWSSIPPLADAPPGAITETVDAAAAPLAVTVDAAWTVVRTGPGAAAVFGGAITGARLLDRYPTEEQAALQDLVAPEGGASGGGSLRHVLALGRRVDGLPLALRVTAVSEADPAPSNGVHELVVQRWGGPCVAEDDPVPAPLPRNGPDHLLSHDARGAVRNAKSFVGFFARKLHGDDGRPVTGVDGQPLDIGILATGLRSAEIADAMLEEVVRFLRAEHDPIVVAPIPLDDIVEGAQARANARLEALAALPEQEDLVAVKPTIEPPELGDRVVLGDGHLLAETFAELLVNARKFGGPDATITITEAPSSGDDGWLVLRVSNSGHRIDPDLAAEAFDCGRMLQPRGERPGVGMGLSLARRVVARHAGRLRFLHDDDADDDVTTLEARLPAAGSDEGVR